MAERKPRDVIRLARLARDIQQKRVLCMDMQKRLDSLERTGVAVAGERWMLGRLQAWLQQALDALQGLEDAESPGARLDEIEQLMAGPEWALADQSLADLSRKDDEQQALLRDHEARLAQWQPQIASLRAQLDAALKVRAPVNRERAHFLKLEAIVARAGRELDEQNLAQLMASLAELDSQQQPMEQTAAAIQQKTETSDPISRQADLLLLRSPLIRRSYQYTVLLRTPSERGSHGVNIQDASRLGEDDHRRLGDAVKSITGMINTGLARAFADQAAAAGATGAGEGGVARDLIPIADPPAQIGAQSVNDVAQNAGDLMYDLLMPRDMQRYLKDTPCSITITTNDLELPWELLWDDQSEQKYLCLERPVARMPMGRAYPRTEERRKTPSQKLRFLLIYADPTGNLPAADAEVDEIARRLSAEWKDNLDIEVLKREQANGDRLNEVLRSGAYDVIHYAGHARFNAREPDQSALLLHRREELSAEKIGRLLKGRPLVFLNACESGRTANEKKPQAVGRYLQRPAEGLASAFIYGGALGCLGALWPVYDDAAADFAIAFYNRVLEGNMIGEAMRQARLHSREKFPKQITWASFVLYGDPTLQLED